MFVCLFPCLVTNCFNDQFLSLIRLCNVDSMGELELRKRILFDTSYSWTRFCYAKELEIPQILNTKRKIPIEKTKQNQAKKTTPLKKQKKNPLKTFSDDNLKKESKKHTPINNIL